MIAVHSLVRLPWAECLLFLCAYARLTRVALSLRLLGFRPIFEQARYPLLDGARPVGPAEIQQARARGDGLRSAARWQPVPTHCLEQSLALQRWLRDDHLPGELRLGVRTPGGRFEAHAWVELGGVVVNDVPDAVAAFRLLDALQVAPSGEVAVGHTTTEAGGQSPAGPGRRTAKRSVRP